MDLINHLYNYCTDFIINLANLSGLSYYEVNFFLFGLLYPILLVALILLFLFKQRQYTKLKKSAIR